MILGCITHRQSCSNLGSFQAFILALKSYGIEDGNGLGDEAIVSNVVLRSSLFTVILYLQFVLMSHSQFLELCTMVQLRTSISHTPVA